MAAGNDNEDDIDDDEASNVVQVPRRVGGVVEVHQPLVAPGPQRVEVECEHHGQGVSAGVLTNQRSVLTFPTNQIQVLSVLPDSAELCRSPELFCSRRESPHSVNACTINQ